MEKQLGVSLILSLEETAIRKSVVHLWSEPDIQTNIKKFSLKYGGFLMDCSLWQETIEDKVKAKVSKLLVSELLKSRMNLLVRRIGLQIRKWMNFLKMIFGCSGQNLEMHLLKELYWTSAGTIKYKKTAEKLVTLDTLNIVNRFELACEHCLVDSLPELWKKLPEISKTAYKCDSGRDLLDPPSYFFHSNSMLQIYWTCFLTGKEYKLLEVFDDFYFHAFESVARKSNEAATAYFFRKLNKGDRDSFLFSRFPNEFARLYKIPFLPDFTPVAWFLFSQMTPEQELWILRNRPGIIFRVFMQWQWQHMFLDKTDLIWNFKSDDGKFDDLLFHINMCSKGQNNFCPELFQEFFCRSPGDFRKYFANHEWQGYVTFCRFLNRKYEQTAKVVLRNIDAEDRVSLVSRSQVFKSLNSLLMCEVDHLVEFCVREACPSKEERERLKELYIGFLLEIGGGKKAERRWLTFFKSLDEIETSSPQRGDSEDARVTKRHFTENKEEEESSQEKFARCESN